MPEQKKYLIEIPDMPEGSGIWDAAKWERHKDAFMKKYPTANVFEVGQYDANDTDENDQFMLTFENDPESSGIWDASKWERHKDAFTAKYPDAQVNRVRYVDYWGDAAKQNRARREELNQPDPERDARLAEIGYFDDVSGERKQFDMNSPAAMGLKPVSSAIKQNSVSGETEYLDPKVAEFYANDTAYTERLAERARLDAEYESNPSVIAERKWLAEMEKEKAAYVSKMREETQAAMEKNVDKSAWARGYARKHNPGVATSFATSGDYSKEALAGSLANEKAENYKSAMAYWDKAERVRKEHTTFVQGAKNVAKNWWEEYQSQDDIETFAEVTSILKRLEKEHGNLNEISDEAIEKSLTEDEKYLVRSFFEYSSAMAEAGADMTSWYKGGQIAAEAVPFMLEILATGGFYKAAGDATVGAARKGLAKWIMKSAKGSVARAAKAKTAKVLTSKAGQGIISALAGTAARTAVAPGTYTRMAEATTHIDDEGHLNIVKNMGVAAVDAYIENLSEESGIIFKKLFGIAGKDVKELGKALGGNTFARMGQTLGKNSVMQAIAKGYNTFMPKLEALGFHGLPEEIGEEILGNALREATFVQPGALQEMFVDGNFGTMLIGFAPMTILGAAGSAANIGYVNMEAARMGKQLRERMSGHYRDEQINLLMSGIQSAENAQQVQEAISPIIAAIERRKDSGEISVQQALADVKAVYDYGMLVAKNKAMLFAQGEQNRELADAQRAKLFDTYGKFWREDAKGNQLVQTARLNDGRSVFVLSEPAEDGKITIIDMKDGKKGFANTSDIAQVEVEGKEEKQSETATRSLDRYIDGVIASQTQSAEAVRMGNERNAQIDALRARITDGTKINLGTEGSPVIVIARGTTREGVRVVDSTGAESLLGWEQAADALGTPIKVKTDKELVDEEIAAIAKRNEERRRRSQVSSQSSQQTSQQVATDAANTVQEENKHIPLNEDGTVNEAAFWEQSPEEYAAWNDEQNQDGGADTLEQIANAKNELAALVTQAQSAVMTSNPATRKAAKREVQRLQERLARIEALEQKYLDRAVAPYRQRAQMWMKQTGTQIHLVETEEELAKISTSAAMQSAAGGIVRGLAKDGKAYIYLPGITSESEVDEVFMHETVAHLGLLGLLGQQKYDELCAQVWQMMSEEARRTFLSYAGGQKGPLAAADEYIAHIAERIGAGVAEETELTVWEKIMEIVRNFLRELGFNITMTEQELSALLTAAYADLAKNMKSAEQIAGQKKESREAEAKESRSKTEMKYAELAETLTPEEIVAVAYNDYNAAKEAYETHRKNSLEVMSGESSKSYVERKKAYLEELARLRDQLKEEEEFVDLVRRMTIGETDVALKLLTLQRSGFEVDEQNDDARFSVRYLPTMEQRAEIIDSIVEVTGQPRDVAERWLDSELSLASIVLNDREYLDYAPDAKYKAIKDNSDYPQGTVDFNNICRKRKDFTRMYTRLQRSYPNRIFTAENLADIRTIMSEDGLTVACGLCYVEDRRQKLGEVANAFIEDLQNGFKNYAKKNETKKANAAQFMVLVGGDTYVPSIYDLITLEGSDKLYEEHRGIWEAFGAYNRARGQQTQNTFQGYAEYKREILSWSDAKVKKVNSLGGLRIFSYSDFEAHHLLDIVQIIIDCAARGVMIQGYTKVPEFARVVEKTGIKLNRSLIPLGDTGIVDGKLAYDPVEGIDINDPNFLESNDNIGNILIGINDEQIRLAMADPFIHYIIPYHARQAGTIRAKLNVGAWTNYIDVQNERDINTGKRVKDNINIYTEVLDESITNDRQFVEKYLDVCREKGFIPKFDQFLDKDAEGNYVYTPGYYKFLVDFKLFDETGNILPQKPVVAQFDDAFNAQILEDYAKDERESTGNQMNATYDRLVSALNLGPAEREDVRFSAKDIKDLSPEEGEKIIKENIQKRMRDLAKAENFIQQGLSKGKVTGRFEIALPIDTQRKIKAQMGRDFDSHNVEIGGVRHALKNHGEGGKKLEATSIPITEEDVQLIPYIMVAPDRVEKGSTDGTRESVKFLKNIADGYVVVIEKEWIDSADDLDTINMWAEKKLSNAALPKGQVSTSETVRISRSDAAKIRKDAENAIEKDVRFSIIAEKDADYLAAVEHGDMETAAKMVVEAVKLAMPNTTVVDESGYPREVYRVDEYRGNRNKYTNVYGGVFYADTEEYFDHSDTGYKRENAEPFYINTEGFFDPMSEMTGLMVNSWADILGKKSEFEKYDIEDESDTDRGFYNDGEEVMTTSTDGLALAAQRMGYKGVILRDIPQRNGNDFTEYAVFNSNAIKSAKLVTYDDNGNVIPLSQRFNPENEDIRFSIRSEEQREKLFEDAKAHYGVTKNFNAAGYMLPDGSLLDFSEANDGGDPNSRSLDHRDIEGIIMDNGVEYDSRWMYIADFMNEGAIRLLPESAGINMIQAPTEEQRKKIFDFIYKYNGEVILEINDERLNSVVYMEYDRRTSPARIFRDIDGYFNEGIVPEQDVRFSVVFDSASSELEKDGISINNEVLMNEYGLSDIVLSKNRNYVTLSKVVVADKGKGNGTRFMNALTNVADENGWTLALTPDDSFGASSVSRLKKFYKRFGFKDNKGKNADFNTRESMIRTPEAHFTGDDDTRFSVRTTEITPEVRDEMDTIAATAIVNGNYMKAPNGADTKLTAEQWAMVRTKNFKAWFGDWENDPENASKVVDENGEPKVVYHGTGYEGNVFTSGFFASDEQFATDYGFAGNGFNARVVHAFINMRNPKIVDANYANYDNIDLGRRIVSSDELVDETREEGKYDGLIIKNVDERSTDGISWTDDFIPFSPSQVKSATDNTGTFSNEEEDIRFSIRTKPAPKKTGIGYKVFYLKDGKLYPPMVANQGGVDTPVGVWLDAEEGTRAGVSKTGRPKVKQGGKGTQGGSGTLAYRPGWHLGEIPYAIQFNRKDENGDRTLFPADFVWAEVEYANDVDYQDEAMSYGMNANGKFQHSLAGLPKLPTDGSYRYRTNPNPETDPWIITGAMKVNRFLTPSEVDQMVIDAGREPQKRQEGAVTDEQIEALNEYFFGAFAKEEVRMSVDSRGNTLTPKQEAFFANSKAVDKDGNLLVLYHGTPRAGFTEFKSGWFTTSKEDAVSYSGDRKGRLFDPNEQYVPEVLEAGDFKLGYMTFDSEADRDAFLAEYPEAAEAMSEREFDQMTLEADEEYDDLIARKPELQKIWEAYREYERDRMVVTTIADVLRNPRAYTEEDIRRAIYAIDFNTILDSVDEIDNEMQRKAELFHILNEMNEDADGSYSDIKVPTRVPRNGKGVAYNDASARTYEVYINVEHPYEIDANGRGSEFESGDIYKAVEEALADEQYDGVIVRNWRVGRTQQLGDVVVPKNGSQIKLTSNVAPTEDSDIRFSVNENPTEAQKEAGNYKMGHLNLDGYRITIENPKGSVRRGTDSKGNAWENTLNNDYGYIRGTEGVDGDHIDVYLSDNPSEGNVFVIDQVNPETREFDEHKVMYGFNSAEEAREAYLANFSEGWNGLGTITEVSKDEFKKWIQSSHRKTKPFSEYKSVNAISSQSEGGKAEERNELTAEEKMAINGLFPGAFAEDEDVRFSIRRTDETAEEFTQRAIDDYRSRYAEIVPMHLVEVSSRKSVAAAFGVEEDELPEDIYQNVLRRYELGDVGFYFPGEDKFIIIFARDEIRDGKELEDALIHENIHALINTRTNAPLRVGKWLYDNPVDKVMRDIKDAVIAKYPADRHYEEMLTNWLAPYMVFGGSRKALEKLPVEYRPYIQYIYNELGYDSEREDKRRRAAGAGSASVSEMEPTKMSGSTPSEGGTRKGLERNEAKERPRVVWGKPETDKDTRLSYVPAPGEIELAATKGIATLTYFNVGFDEMRRIFEESISSEEQNIARINEKPTKTAYDMERLRRAERELMASQMRLDWWNSVNDRLINTSLVEADVKSALQDTEPRNIAEYLSQFFTMRVDRVNSYGVDKDGKPVVRKVNKKVGVMLTPETLEKELGWSSKDWSGIGYIVSAKDGRSLDAIAEMISEDADAQPFIAGMDTMDIKNEIISFIQSVGSYTEIRDYIKNERTKEAQGLAGYVNGKIQERINGIEESTGMSVDEYNARIISEAIAELEDSLVSLETSEIFGNFEQLTNDDYEGYIEAVSRGEDGGAYEGAEDLSEAGDYGGRVDSKDEGEPEDGDSHSGRDDSGSVGDRPGEAGGDGVPPIGHKAKGVVPASVPLDTEGMSVDEIVREGKMKAAAENADAAESFTERINRINNALAQLRSALAAQRSYDKDTVRIITNLANDLLQGGRLSDMTRGEIKRLLSVIKDAVGKEDLSVSVDRLMDIMIANQLRFGKSRFEEFLKIKATKVNASGVEARGKLDVAGQQMMQYLKEGIASSMTDEMLSERIATEENNLDSESEVIRGNAENKLVGYYLARLYRENIKASEAEEKDLREEIKDAKVQYDAGMMDKVAYKEFIDSCYEAIRENRMQRVNAFESLNAALAEKIAGSIIAGKMLADAEKARIERIHHFANSDMEGMPSVQQGKVKGGFWNNTVLRFLFKPLATFDQMLRSFAPKSRSGEGYLWNHFMGGWLKASENEFKGIQKAHEMLDEKVRSVFKEAKRWSDLFAIEKRMPTMDVKFWDGEKMADFKLTQGNLLYIYMVSKMTDGKMKLSKMGITDVDVRNMVTEMDPRFIELADWIQESFLPTLREKYNEVHVRLFGAPMAAIDNYFPIRVLANARTREVDLAVEESSSKPSTITGSIIKRTKNSLALDILGSDAFDVVLEHIEQMEKWAAFAEFNKDLNTLLSYNKFRNRVQNSKGIYGSGTVAWNNFRAVAEIAAGVYKPAVKSDSLDKLITNIAKGVTGAKISFRVYTALKQFLSAPAFVSDASAAALIKNLANPYKAWTWAMNELPLFEKRWKSRQAGDSRLMETEADWELWKNKIVELAGRYGMTPNAFVDALTVSIGARAIYETKLKEYLEYGYSPERAEEKAKRDATVLFNESQQSNESAFLSAAQVDRTVASILITVFRNSSMGYQRMYVDGIRNIGHMLKKGYREQSIEFMKKQMVRDGLEEDKAARAAERIYNRSLAKNAARVATFGFLVQFAWNLGPYMAYLLMGDDDEEKKDMITDAAVRGVVGGPVEGLAAGQVIGTILGDIATGEDISEPTLELPATSDLENAFNQLKSDPVRAVNDMFNLLVQSGIGVNPQTITDAIVAIVDACNGDMETSKEVAFALMRILQTPQSQIDKLYKEEIGFAEDEGLDIRIHEFAERYAKYKVTRNAPLAKWLYSDEREKELEDRFIKRFLNDAEDLKRSQGSEEAKTFYEYYDVEYKKIPQTLRDLRKQAKENPYRSESLSKEANRILETDEFKLYEEVLPHIKMYEHHKKQMKEAPDGFTRAEEEIKMREEMEAVVEILRGREQE